MITNNNKLPISLAVWLAQSDYDNVQGAISATGLLKPLKSMILGSKHSKETDLDIMDLVSSRMGTAIHSAIENSWLDVTKVKQTLTNLNYPANLINSIKINPDPATVTKDDLPIYMEIRTTKEIDGVKITGKYDFICNGQVEDFKNTSTYSYTTGSNVKDYILQGSLYRWLNPNIITEDTMRINYIFNDWSAAKVKQEKNYPPSKALSVEYLLLSLQETEAFVRSKISQIKQYLDKPQAEMPACTPEELWQEPTVFKYYKNPTKKAKSTKNFDEYWEAHERYVKDGMVGEVVTIPGIVKRCKYCSVKDICEQAQSYIKEGRLNT